MSYFDKYILEGRTPVMTDTRSFSIWFETADRKVAHTEIDPAVTISTVFLGADHNFGEGPPLLFETMVFGGPIDGYTVRTSTYDDAEEAHERTVELAKHAYITEG